MFIAFGYVVVKWRINKLEKEKEKLTRLVDEQTSEIKEQAEKLKELDKIKSRFFANISRVQNSAHTNNRSYRANANRRTIKGQKEKFFADIAQLQKAAGTNKQTSGPV